MSVKRAKPKLLRPRRLRLRILVIATGALVVAIALGAAGLLAAWQGRTATAAQQRAHLLLSARHLALGGRGAFASRAPALVLQPLIESMRKDEPGLAFAAVVSADGTVRGHLEARRVGEGYLAPEPAQVLGPLPALHPGEALSAGETLVLAESPVLDAEGARLGRAIVGFDRRALAAQARVGRIEQMLMLGLLLVLLVGGLGFALKRLLAPLARLRGGLDQVDRKQVELPVPAGGCREQIALLESFNALSARLAEQRQPAAPAAAPAASATSAAPGPSAAEQDALRRLARAHKEGKRIQLPATIEALGELRGWARANLEQAGLPEAQTSNLVNTLHAQAATLAEEAHELDPRQRIELWWVGPASDAAGGEQAAGGECCFILREKGRPGAPHKHYFPGTEAGNLTLIPVTLAPQPAPAGEA